MNSEQMKTQGARCPCGGSDDYCVCQNVDLAALRERQKETAKDTYFAIAEYKARIDWFEAKVATLTAERDEARHHYDCAVVSWAECRQRAEKAECHEDAQRSTIGMLTRRAERAEAKVDEVQSRYDSTFEQCVALVTKLKTITELAEASEASAAALRTALEDIAKRRRIHEMDNAAFLAADWSGGYDECVRVARAAIAAKVPG